MSPTPLEVTPDGLWDGQRLIRLLSGEVHYWRLDPDDWHAVLGAVADLGFPAVSTYVPWAVHDRGDGAADFTGALDVGRFLDAVEDAGLSAIVRVGPDCGAETPTSGWPRRIVEDPDCQALRPDGTPYLLVTATSHMHPPSYAAPRVLDAVAGWYDLVLPHLVDRQHPDGPVVAVQVDNEIGYHFQSHAFALDHHPAFVTGFRRFLRGRYGSIERLNEAWQTDYPDVAAIEAPRDVVDGPEQRRVAWVAWREQHLRDVVTTFATMARDRGIDRVPIVHNQHPRTESPIDIGAMEAEPALDLCGADVYVTRHGAGFARDLVRHLSGSSRLPWLAELGAGWLALPWLLPMGVSALDEEHVALRTLLGGARAANVYMLVDRDRWYGSPIARDGSLRPGRAETWRRVTATVAAAGLDGLVRHAPVLVVENRAETRRIAARDTLADAIGCFDQLVPLDHRLTSSPHPDTDAYRSWYDRAVAAVAAAGLDHDRATSTCLPDLDRYDLVLMPTLDVVDPGTWRQLTSSSARIVIGPRPPTLDGDGRPLVEATDQHVTVLAELGALSSMLPAPRWRGAHPDLDVVCWRGPDREVLVTANTTDDPLDTTLRSDVATAGVLRDVVDGLELVVREGSDFQLHLDPWEIRAWEVGP